jgi:hypothetical protein
MKDLLYIVIILVVVMLVISYVVYSAAESAEATISAWLAQLSPSSIWGDVKAFFSGTSNDFVGGGGDIDPSGGAEGDY